MHPLRALITVTITFLLSYSVWYMVFWFVTNQSNLFLWEWWIKLIYLLLGYNSCNNILEKQNEEL